MLVEYDVEMRSMIGIVAFLEGRGCCQRADVCRQLQFDKLVDCDVEMRSPIGIVAFLEGGWWCQGGWM
jgi:hypothetical protein